MQTRCEVAVIGGGLAGYAVALGLAESGVDTVLLAPAPPADRRSTAVIGDALEFLTRLGVIDALNGASQPLETMRLIDDTGRLFRAPTVEFHASEIDRAAFGLNILNADLAQALRQCAERYRPHLTVWSRSATEVALGGDHVSIETTDGGHVRCQLAVGADGRRSRVREAGGIRMREWSYPQAAIVLNFGHERPHDGVSTEFHTRTGPFTTVPLPGRRSSLVWVETPERAKELEQATAGELSGLVEQHMHSLLGRVQVEVGWQTFPLQGAIAERLTGRRIALVGEAAHVFPPIGAQGLNLGLRDAAAVVDAVSRHRDDPGGEAMLADYALRRRSDVLSRSVGVDWLNRSLLTDLIPVQTARSLGLGMLARSSRLRQLVMREGVSPGSAFRRSANVSRESTSVSRP